MTAIAQRDAGASSALSRAGGVWRDLAEYYVYCYLERSGPALFEEARAYAEGCFEATPPNPNAWGALALHMSTGALIEKTGQHRQSASFVSNHARSAAMWRARPLPVNHGNALFG